MTSKFRFRILTQGLSLNRGQELWITEQFLSPCGPVHFQFIIPVSPTRWGLPGSSSGCHQASTLSFSQQEITGEICFSSLIAKQMGCYVPLNIFISAGVGSKGSLVGLKMGGGHHLQRIDEGSFRTFLKQLWRFSRQHLASHAPIFTHWRMPENLRRDGLTMGVW